MNAKKPVCKSNEKSHGTNVHTAAKRKPLSGVKPAAQVMDARSSQDRRDSDRREKEAAVTVDRRMTERRTKVSRRHQIDPTTCERDYSSAEVEFMGALDEYKRRSGRMFPTCSEILEVLHGLGYEKHSADSIANPAPSAAPLAHSPLLPTTSEAAV